MKTTTYSGLSGMNLTVRVPTGHGKQWRHTDCGKFLTARDADDRVPYGEDLTSHTGP